MSYKVALTVILTFYTENDKFINKIHKLLQTISYLLPT